MERCCSFQAARTSLRCRISWLWIAPPISAHSRCRIDLGRADRMRTHGDLCLGAACERRNVKLGDAATRLDSAPAELGIRASRSCSPNRTLFLRHQLHRHNVFERTHKQSPAGGMGSRKPRRSAKSPISVVVEPGIGLPAHRHLAGKDASLPPRPPDCPGLLKIARAVRCRHRDGSTHRGDVMPPLLPLCACCCSTIL